MNQFNRTEKLIGVQGIQQLEKSKVAIVGLGGVGSFVTEAIIRAGVGHVQLWDCDVVDITNINRQLFALQSTVGRLKTEVAKGRALDINPDIKLNIQSRAYESSQTQTLVDYHPSYVIDCIDSIKDKIDLIDLCQTKGIRIISVLGAGNKLNPQFFKIGNLKETHTDPIARVLRRESKARKWKKFPVVWSDEPPKATSSPVGSISFVPSVAGLLAASYVINDLLSQKGDNHGTDCRCNEGLR